MTTKLHALCDARGNPLRFILTPGNASDFTQAGLLLDGVKAGSVLGDKGYDSDAIVEAIKASGANVVIPPKENRIIKRLCDFALYCERWSRRALLQQTQALPRHRNPIRKAKAKLSCLRDARIRHALDQMIVNRT